MLRGCFSTSYSAEGMHQSHGCDPSFLCKSWVHLDDAPENGWLEDKPFLLGRPIFRGYVSFGEGNISHLIDSNVPFWKGHEAVSKRG